MAAPAAPVAMEARAALAVVPAQAEPAAMHLRAAAAAVATVAAAEPVVASPKTVAAPEVAARGPSDRYSPSARMVARQELPAVTVRLRLLPSPNWETGEIRGRPRYGRPFFLLS
jgi:hypothetical protein